MCFFQRFVFSCGDYQWGPFQQYCNKDHPTGESCGLKLIAEVSRASAKCSICKKIERKRRKLAAEVERIRCWQNEARSPFRQCVLQSFETIAILNTTIVRLESTRPKGSLNETCSQDFRSEFLAREDGLRSTNLGQGMDDTAFSRIRALTASLNARCLLPTTPPLSPRPIVIDTEMLSQLRNQFGAMVQKKHSLKSGVNIVKITELDSSYHRRHSVVRTLLAKYHTLDALAHMEPDVINSCLDLIHAEPPSRPIVEALASVCQTKPVPWLKIGKQIRNLHTDVLQTLSEILNNALQCTEVILNHTARKPTLTVQDQRLINAFVLARIKARKVAIVLLYNRTDAFISSLTIAAVTPSQNLPQGSSSEKQPISAIAFYVQWIKTHKVSRHNVSANMQLAQTSTRRSSHHMFLEVSLTYCARLFYVKEYLTRKRKTPNRLGGCLSDAEILQLWEHGFKRYWGEWRLMQCLFEPRFDTFESPLRYQWCYEVLRYFGYRFFEASKNTGLDIAVHRLSLPCHRRVAQALVEIYRGKTEPVGFKTDLHFEYLIRKHLKEAPNMLTVASSFNLTGEPTIEEDGAIVSRRVETELPSRECPDSSAHAPPGSPPMVREYPTTQSEDCLSNRRTFCVSFVASVALRVCNMLGLIEPALEPSKVRVRWRCRCGASLYDDFTEKRPGAAKDLEKRLNMAYTQAPTSTDQTGGAANLSASRSNDRYLPIRPANSQPSPFPRPWSGNAYDPSPQRSTTSLTIVDGQSESNWLLVCAPGKKRPTSLSQLSIKTSTSDTELFKRLRTVYLGCRNRLSSLLSLRTVQSIRFVQFELHVKDLVDIRKVPDMPPDTKRGEYLYQPSDTIPPIGENMMTHWFHHPEDANQMAITCVRTPKKRRDRLIVCPQAGTGVGWGIQIVEGWFLSKVWLLALLLFMLGSLVFGICWATLRFDVQGAFGVSAYMVAFASLLVGTLQACFG